MPDFTLPGIRPHKAEKPIDAEMRALVTQIACACVAACCDCLTSRAAALTRRVELLGEPLDTAAAAVGLGASEARTLLEDARWAAAQTVVQTLAAEPRPASGISECRCEAR